MRADGVNILVLGDVNLDTLFVPLAPDPQPSDGGRMAWQTERNYWLHRRRGGAWLLKEIIDAAVSSRSFAENVGKPALETYAEEANGVDNAALASSLPANYLTSSVILGLFPSAAAETSGGENQVYRIEKFVGWVHSQRPVQTGQNNPYARRLVQCLEPYAQGDKIARDILVLHDRAGYFRRLPGPFLENVVTRQFEEGKTWIVWHMYSPLAENQLWDVFQRKKEWLDRTIVVAKMECIRQAGLNLPQKTSLEQESRLFAAGMETVKSLTELAKVRHVVVHQQREGVLHWDRQKKLQSSCYYCPKITHDSTSRERGIMVGYTSILVAAIVRGMVWSLMYNRKQPEREHPEEGIVAGMKQGAVLDHLHYLNAFGPEAITMSTDLPTPYHTLFESLTKVANANWEPDGGRYKLAALPLPPAGEDLSKWSRIEGFINRQFLAISEETRPTLDAHAENIACDVVRRGLQKVVEDERQDEKPEPPDTPPHTVRCPYEVHGKIITAYHEEIDSFASIQQIIAKYLNDEGWTTPLSIAVFGWPGSGKSFTIWQIVATLRDRIAKRPLEFNLAQFEGVKDLEIAFHKVQDEAVAGEVPLVFFDEFDARNFDWLKNFLAPMQDGTFKSGESTYRIGRAIFVFAGGVSTSWSVFLEKSKANTDPKSGLKEAKLTDFVSRLRGHLDIKSINVPETTGSLGPSVSREEVNNVLMFRRAILLRSLLEEHLASIFDKRSKEARIDAEVLRAFLRIPRYEHEARSMRAIIEMSRTPSRGRFQKSFLPAADQLNMHVDAKTFLELMKSPT
jgi:hypothetical protein